MLPIIEVFKTNVQQHEPASRLVLKLQRLFPGSKVNFDLEDCDRVLRVEGHSICVEKIKALLWREGFECCELA